MAADWCRRTQLRLGSEKDTGRALLGPDGKFEIELVALPVVAVVVGFLQPLIATVLFTYDPLGLVSGSDGGISLEDLGFM